MAIGDRTHRTWRSRARWLSGRAGWALILSLGVALLMQRQSGGQTPPSPADVRGFEGIGWTSTAGAVNYDTFAVQGAKSLRVDGGGYVELTATSVGRVEPVPTSIKFDVWLPPQVNPSWGGAVAAYLTAPSRNVWRAWVGQRELQGMAASVWHLIDLGVPASVVTQLGSSPIDDLQVTLVVNVPQGSGAVRLDNLRLGNEGSPSVGASGPELVARVMKMESAPADWTLGATTGTVQSTDTATGGRKGMKLAGIRNYTPVASRRLTKLADVTDRIAVDLMLPPSLSNESPFWFGQIQAYVEAPSLGIYNVFLGAGELTGLALGVFHTARFTLPNDVMVKLRDSNYSDLFFTLVVNAPSTNTGDFVLDELRFISAGDSPTPPPSPSVPGVLPQETVGVDVVAGTVTVMPVFGGGWRGGTPLSVPGLAGSTASCIADVDGNATSDVVFANPTTGRLSYLPRLAIDAADFDPTGVKHIDTSLPSGRPGPLACGDLDGDGDVDLVTSISGLTQGAVFPTLSLVAYMNAGNGVFSRQIWDSGVPAGAELAGKALADFDGDQRPDLAVFAADTRTPTGAQVFVYHNTGQNQAFSAGSRTSLTTPATLIDPDGPNWGALTAADFDNDGKSDLWVLGNSGTVFAYGGLGGGTFKPPLQAGIIDGARARHALEADDLDGDGLMDLMLTHWPDGYPGRPADNALIAALGPRAIWYRNLGLGKVTTLGDQFRLLISFLGRRHFHPGVPATVTSGPVGLVKGKAVITPYVMSSGTFGTGTFVVSVAGHVLERRQSETVAGAWAWRDYGAPTGTAATGAPAVAVTSIGTRITRWVFVRGLNGHLYELDVDGDPSTEMAPAWIDLGLPPPVSDGPQPVNGSSTSFADIRATTLQINPSGAGGSGLVGGGGTGLTGGTLPNPPVTPYVSALLNSPSRASNGVSATFLHSPTVVIDTDNAQPVMLIFALDSLGRLHRYHMAGRTGGWDGHHGNIGGTGSGWIGDGSPTAVAWRAGNGHTVQVYVPDAKRRLQMIQMQVPKLAAGTTFNPLSLNPVASPWQTVRNNVTGTPGIVSWNGGGEHGSIVIIRDSGGHNLSMGISVGGAPEWQTNSTIGVQTSVSPRVSEFVGSDPEVVTFGNRLIVLARSSASQEPFPSSTQTLPSQLAGNLLLYADRQMSTTTQVTVDPSDLCQKCNNPPCSGMCPPSFVTTVTQNIRQGAPLPWTTRIIPLPAGTNPDIIAPTGGRPHSNAFQLWATGADGVIEEGTLVPPTTMTWNPAHRDASTPVIVPSDGAFQSGCNPQNIISALESILPQWAPVITPDTVARTSLNENERPCMTDPQTGQVTCPLTDANLYPDGDHFRGYQAEKPRSLTGTVISSSIAGIDMFINHTHRLDQVPRVAHDWNIVVAPDIEYQHMMSEANLIKGGVMWVEWEQDDVTKMPLVALPVPGDHVSVHGRWVYDCGHPPFHTEIHPPDTVMVINKNFARLVLKDASQQQPQDVSPRFWQPSDPRLIDEFKCNETASAEVLQIINIIKDAGIPGLIIFLYNSPGICSRFLPLFPATPSHLCYGPYAHTLNDVLGQNEKMVFDIPLPPHPTVPSPTDDFVAANAQLVSASTGIGFGIQAGVSATVLNGPPRFHVEFSPWEMGKVIPDVFQLVRAQWAGQPQLPGGKTVRACYSRVPAGPKASRTYDDFHGDVPGPDFCDEDTTEEPIIYYSSSNFWQRVVGWNQVSVCEELVPLRAGEDLRIGVRGFECDVSCSEYFDSPVEDVAEGPDDHIGGVDVVMSPFNNWGLVAGQTPIYQTLSQSNLATQRARDLSPGDAMLSFTVTEVLTGDL